MRVMLSPDERFLEVAFPEPLKTLSWALVGAGFGVHERVVFHHVRRGELPLEVDPHALLLQRLAQRGYRCALAFLTARDLRPYGDASAESGAVVARAIVTVGLGNALSAGDPPAPHREPVGTINVLAVVSAPLSDAGMVEALALACEARTAALLALGVPSIVSGLPATGTGTDCIAVACPRKGAEHSYAGKHTDVGAALGRSVREATERAAREWLREQSATR